MLEKELLNDAKQCAEHIMLVDLGRNDVGKVYFCLIVVYFVILVVNCLFVCYYFLNADMAICHIYQTYTASFYLRSMPYQTIKTKSLCHRCFLMSSLKLLLLSCSSISS